jgi:ADP-heptose:LPS heptosyltransferase
METNQSLLDIILKNNEKVHRENIASVLVLYEDRQFFIGDSCVRFDQLRLCRLFFPNASVDINLNDDFTSHYKDLLLNNPYVDNIFTSPWDQLRLEKYDMVICITYHEKEFLLFLQDRYGAAIIGAQFPIAVFSISAFMLRAMPEDSVVFPVYQELFQYSQAYSRSKPYELYISEEERQWADNWLQEHGVKKGEQLVISLDSSSRRDKLLRMDVYFSVLKYLLSIDGVKVLNFDEKSLGKKAFYEQWLGGGQVDKMIFSNSLSLREVLCILSSSYTSLVIGPCTGLMHCASAIYNNFVGKSMPLSQVPVMITYTGKYYGAKENAENWWGNSPLVSCLFVHMKEGTKTMRLLSDLQQEEKKHLNESLVCTEYTAVMMVDFLRRSFQERQTDLAKKTNSVLL